MQALRIKCMLEGCPSFHPSNMHARKGIGVQLHSLRQSEVGMNTDSHPIFVLPRTNCRGRCIITQVPQSGLLDVEHELMPLSLGAKVCVNERRVRSVVPNPGGDRWHRNHSPHAAGTVPASDDQWLDTSGKVSATVPPRLSITLLYNSKGQALLYAFLFPSLKTKEKQTESVFLRKAVFRV